MISLLLSRSLSQQELLDGRHEHSFLVSCAVKWIESAGARVLPIMLDREPEYYDSVVQQVNGILFPGGGESMVIRTAGERLI